MKGGIFTDINREEFEELCRLQYTPERMCVYFGCAARELRRWIRAGYGRAPEAVIATLSERGRADFLRIQLELAGKNASAAGRLEALYLPKKDEESGRAARLRRIGELERLVLDGD